MMWSFSLCGLLSLAAVPGEGVEVLGVEYMPGWLRTETASDLSLRANAKHGAGILRMATMSWGYLYWSAGVVGYGLTDAGARPTKFYFFGTEAGIRLVDRGAHELRLGLGIGLGRFEYARGSSLRPNRRPDIGVGWSPTLRYAYRIGDNFSAGAGLRALAVSPGDNSPGGLLGAFIHVGWHMEVAKSSSRPRSPRLEVIALELMPWWIRSRRSGDWSPVASAVPGAFFFRFGTLKWTHVYWTPVVTGFGVSAFGGDTPTAFAVFATELGGLLIEQEGHSLRLGLAVGGGFFEFAFVSDTRSAGAGLMLGPTLRYAYQLHPNFFLGVGVRTLTLLPNQNSPGAMGGLVFDVGWSLDP